MYIYIYIHIYLCIYMYIYIYVYNFFKYTHIVRCLVAVFEAQPTIPRYSEEKCQPCFFCECVKTQDKWDICFLRYLNFMVHFVYFFFKIMYRNMWKRCPFNLDSCAWMARVSWKQICQTIVPRISAAKTSIYLNILGFALVWKLACR